MRAHTNGMGVVYMIQNMGTSLSFGGHAEHEGAQTGECDLSGQQSVSMCQDRFERGDPWKRRSRWIQNASVLCDRRHSSRFGFELDCDLGGGGAHYGRRRNGSQSLKGRVRVDKIVSFFFFVFNTQGMLLSEAAAADASVARHK